MDNNYEFPYLMEVIVNKFRRLLLDEQAPNLTLRPTLVASAVRGLMQERKIAVKPEDERHPVNFTDRCVRQIRILCTALRRLYDNDGARERVFRKAFIH